VSLVLRHRSNDSPSPSQAAVLSFSRVKREGDGGRAVTGPVGSTITFILLDFADPVEWISFRNETISSASALCPNDAVLSMEDDRVESRLMLAMVVSPAPCTCCSR